MKNKLIKTAALFCTSLSLTCVQPATGTPPESDPESLLENLKRDQSDRNQADIKAVNKNGKGTITYNGEEVWRGRVKNDLKVIGKIASNDDSKYSEGTELAAVWDGDKLLWENVPGAAKELEPEFREMEERRKAALENLRG